MVDELASGLNFIPLQFSRNKIEVNIAAAPESLTLRSDLRYLLTIKTPTFRGSNTFQTLRVLDGREKPPYTVEGVTIYEGATFPINRGRGGIIDSLLEYQKPTRKQTNIRAILTQTIPYQLTQQVQGGTPAQNSTAVFNPTYAIKSGLSSEDFAVFGEVFWSDFQSKQRKFLTWKPNNQRVVKNQEEYLYFVLNFTPLPSEIRLRVQYRNYGYEATEAVTKLTISNVPQFAVVSVPVGPEIVGIGDTNYDYYDVWLSDGNNNRLSEVRTYQYSRDFEAFEKSILFVNSLGGWDTLRCEGRSKQTLGVNQSAAQRERKYTSVEESDILLIKTEGTRTISVSTGFIRRDVAENLKWLDELLLSEELYWVTDKGHLPIQVITNSLDDREDDADVVARTVTFKVRDIVENYSAINADYIPTTRPTVWVGANPVYAVDSFGKRTGYVTYSTLRKAYANTLELVKPFEFKSNAAGDPDYIQPNFDTGVVVGSTPYPNTEIRRLGTFKRNTCGGGGTSALIVIPAGKYGGEIDGVAQALAEAEFSATDTQEYANQNGACLFQSAAFSRLSTYVPNTCTGGKSGIPWTISVPAGAYTSEISQAHANAQASAYADSLDTQANANLFGTCGWGNTAIGRYSNYSKNTCTGGMVSSLWYINVPANTFVSAVSQADANAQAQAYINQIDTQENANANATCRFESACTSKTTTFLIQSGANIGRPLTMWFSRGVFTSLISQADADAKVEAHFQANYNVQSVVNNYANFARDNTDYCTWNMYGQATFQVRN